MRFLWEGLRPPFFVPKNTAGARFYPNARDAIKKEKPCYQSYIDAIIYALCALVNA